VKDEVPIPTNRLSPANRQLADRADDLGAVDVLDTTVAAEGYMLFNLDPHPADGAPG
jgi:hypothetical protein